MRIVASEMMHRITSYRNPNGSEYEWTKVPLHLRKPASFLRVAVAEVRYIAVIPIAIVETAFRAIAMFFAYCVYHTNLLRLDYRETFDVGLVDIKRNFFCILWAANNAWLNLFCNDLVENGANVWKAAQEGTFSTPSKLEFRCIDGRPSW